jgi:RNA 2',3'-cyclic 3'-phosphodiesterase
MANSSYSADNNKRIFIGIKIPLSDNLKETCEVIKKDLSTSHIKWSPPENFHITLRFLGKIPDSLLKPLNKVIAESISDVHSFEIILHSIAVFGKTKPKIIWVGVRNSQSLNEIYIKVNEALETVGFDFDNQDFHPHLTLGRIKKIYSLSVLDNIVEKYHNKIIQKSTVSEISVFESILEKQGARYTILHSQKLH